MEEGAASVGSFCVSYNQDGVILVRKGLEAMCVSSQGTFSNIDSAEAEVGASEAAWWHRTKWGKRPFAYCPSPLFQTRESNLQD